MNNLNRQQTPETSVLNNFSLFFSFKRRGSVANFAWTLLSLD